MWQVCCNYHLLLSTPLHSKEIYKYIYLYMESDHPPRGPAARGGDIRNWPRSSLIVPFIWKPLMDRGDTLSWASKEGLADNRADKLTWPSKEGLADNRADTLSWASKEGLVNNRTDTLSWASKEGLVNNRTDTLSWAVTRQKLPSWKNHISYRYKTYRLGRCHPSREKEQTYVLQWILKSYPLRNNYG